MKKLCLASLLVGVLWMPFVSLGADEAPLNSHLEPLRPLLEKTWRGEFKDSKPEKPTIDISHWERALNGSAVRILHSINDGIYGGESLVIWDEKKQEISYHYFTTAGFTSAGTMRIEGKKFITHEVVTGNSDSVTEVRGTTEIHSDGTFTVKSEYLKNGSWVPGHEATYHQDAGSKVVFK